MCVCVWEDLCTLSMFNVSVSIITQVYTVEDIGSWGHSSTACGYSISSEIL